MAEITAYTTSLECQAERLGATIFLVFTDDTFSVSEMFFSAQVTGNISKGVSTLCSRDGLPLALALFGSPLPVRWPGASTTGALASSACAPCYYNQPYLFPALSTSVLAAGSSPTSSGSAFKGIRLESSPSKHFFITENEEERVQLKVFISGVK